MSSLLADIALQVDLVDIALMTLLVVVAIAIIRLRDLFEVVVLSGIFSLLSACIFTTLDAVDVAFTEAAVGAGISTVLFLTTLSLTSRREASQYRHSRAGIVVCLVTGGALVYGTLDMPHFGDPEAPVHQHVAPRYIGESPREIGVPNMVTSVLASYRGYDTLGETAVIFTAGLTVLLLLRRSGRGDAHKAVDERRDGAAMRDAMVLRVMSKLFIPLILLFALYVQFHGDFGPGGGFPAGVLFAFGDATAGCPRRRRSDRWAPSHMARASRVSSSAPTANPLTAPPVRNRISLSNCFPMCVPSLSW